MKIKRSLIFCVLCIGGLIYILTKSPARPIKADNLALMGNRSESIVSSAVYPLKVSSNARYLVDQNNTPFFMSGDAPWSLIAQGTNSDIDTYLDNRQQKGFNTILINLIEHKFATLAPADIYGDKPFTGATFTTPNEAYFQHADYVISGAAKRGMVVLLVPLYLGFDCGDEGWCAEVQAASTTDLQSWGRYVGNRYKTYNNIVWVIDGDADRENPLAMPLPKVDRSG